MRTAPVASGLWRRGDFLKLWTAQAVSAFGARITREGLPLAAVMVLGANPAALGILAALATAPAVIVGLAAGGWIDRGRRRPLLIGADLARAAILLSIPAAVLLRRLSIVQLYVAAALVGGASVLFDIADHAYLPTLIDREDLVDGNSKLGATESIAEIAGPAVAGVMFQALTAPFAVTVNALTYLISATFLGAIKRRESARPGDRAPMSAGWRADVALGFTAIWSHPLVRPLFLMGLVQSLFGAFFAALYVIFALKTLGLSPAMLGMTIAIGEVGALAGSVCAPRLTARFGVGPTIIAAAFGAGLATLLIPLAHGEPVLAMAILMISQLFGDALAVAASIAAISLRQSVLPSQALGRSGALFRAGQGGLAVVGALAGGLFGGVLGPRVTLVAAAVGLSLAPAFALASPLSRLRAAPARV